MLTDVAPFSICLPRPERTNSLVCMSYVLLILLALLSSQVLAKTTVLWNENTRVTPDIQKNIELSLTNYSGYPDCSAVTVLNKKRQQRALGKIILASFHSFGRFATQITQLELQTEGECQNWLAQASNIEPSLLKKITFSKSLLNSNETVFQDLIKRYKTLLNQPFQQAEYQAFKDDIYTQAIAHGYFDIELKDQIIEILEGGHSVAVTFDIALGKRYKIQQFKLINTTINPDLIFDLIKFQPGEAYSIGKLNTLTKALQKTQFFVQVSIRPDIASRNMQNHTVDIHVNVTEKQKHWINFGAGVSTDDGLRTSITWTRPRLNNAGHSLRAATQLSVPEQQATFTYKIPFVNTNKDYLSFQAGIQNIDRNDTQSLTSSIGLQRYFAWGDNDWQHNLFTRYEYSEFRQGAEPRNYSELLFLGASTTVLKTDNPLYPTQGTRKTITLSTAQNSLLSDQTIYKLSAQGKWLLPLVKSNASNTYHWLSIIDVGLLEADDFFTVPSIIRFYGGGDQSIRGFAFQALSPIDADGVATGADRMFSTQQEIFMALNDNWHFAFGVDALHASTTQDIINAYSTNIGAHWRSPVGPIRFYVSRGYSNFENTWRLHLLMGPLL